MHDLCFLAVHQKRVRLVYDNTISLAICRHIYLHIYTHTQTHNRAEFHTNFKSSKVGHPPPPHTPSPCGRHHHDWALHFPAKYHAESLSAPSWRVCMYACWYRHNHISYIANHHQLGTISMSLESALVCGCVRACMYVCVYIFIRMYNHLYIRIHMSKFSSKLTEKLLPVVDSIVTPPCRVIIFLKTQLYRHSISGRWISSSTSTCTCTHRNHLPGWQELRLLRIETNGQILALHHGPRLNPRSALFEYEEWTLKQRVLIASTTHLHSRYLIEVGRSGIGMHLASCVYHLALIPHLVSPPPIRHGLQRRLGPSNRSKI